MDIVGSAESGTYWKNIIYEIVSTQDFDPWDIDVGVLADSYMDNVRVMKLINFDVPGTVVLVGSVLVRLKSDIVSGQTFLFEESLSGGLPAGMEEEPVADIDEVTGRKLPPSLIENMLYVRRIPKRKVTLPELMIFLKRVIAQVETREIVRTGREERRLEVQVNKKNVERIMREVYQQIRQLSKGDKVKFRDLVDDWKKESVVAYLIPVLHLANKDKIKIEQPTLFGDIFLSPS
jgi:segregation and condensation protein A